jgi:hypothetical protein
MCTVKAMVSDDYGLLGVAERRSRLAERYSLYIQEMINLQRRLQVSDIRKENRAKRLLDLRKRLIPALEAQLQA